MPRELPVPLALTLSYEPVGFRHVHVHLEVDYKGNPAAAHGWPEGNAIVGMAMDVAGNVLTGLHDAAETLAEWAERKAKDMAANRAAAWAAETTAWAAQSISDGAGAVNELLGKRKPKKKNKKSKGGATAKAKAASKRGKESNPSRKKASGG